MNELEVIKWKKFKEEKEVFKNGKARSNGITKDQLLSSLNKNVETSYEEVISCGFNFIETDQVIVLCNYIDENNTAYLTQDIYKDSIIKRKKYTLKEETEIADIVKPEQKQVKDPVKVNMTRPTAFDRAMSVGKQFMSDAIKTSVYHKTSSPITNVIKKENKQVENKIQTALRYPQGNGGIDLNAHSWNTMISPNLTERVKVYLTDTMIYYRCPHKELCEISIEKFKYLRTRYPEAKISAKLKVPYTAIRSMVKRLTEAGLLDVSPKRDTSISYKQIVEDFCKSDKLKSYLDDYYLMTNPDLAVKYSIKEPVVPFLNSRLIEANKIVNKMSTLALEPQRISQQLRSYNTTSSDVIEAINVLGEDTATDYLQVPSSLVQSIKQWNEKLKQKDGQEKEPRMFSRR